VLRLSYILLRGYVFFKTALEKEWHLAEAVAVIFFRLTATATATATGVRLKKHLPKDRQSFVDVQFLSA
jgi:hypothetical protein